VTSFHTGLKVAVASIAGVILRNTGRA